MRGVVILSAILVICLSRFASAACNSNSECLTAAAPYCVNQTCLGCLVNAHCRASEYCTNAGVCAARPTCGSCAAYTNAPVCSSTKCVQCTANSQCASGVCDTVVKVCRPPTTCATNATVCAGTDRPVCSSAGNCVECLSDSDCSAAFPTCTAAGVCTAQVLQPILMCSQNSTVGKRTLYTSFKSTQNNVAVTYPVGSRNALYIVGDETTLLNSVDAFTLVNTTRQYYYPGSFEKLEIDIGAEVMWYLDGVVSTLTLDSTSDCPTNVTFVVGVADLTYVQSNKQNVSDTIANVLGVDTSRVDINTATAKRSAQQFQNFFEVTVVDGAAEVLAVLNNPTAFNNALTDLGLTVTGLQGSQLLGEPTPTPDGASPPLSTPSTAGTPVTTPANAPADVPTDIPATPSNAVPVTPVATFPPSADISPSGVVAAPGALDSGIIVAIVVVCVVVAAAVIIIAVVVSRNKKKKSGGGSGSSRMERGSATEMKETTSAAALVTTSNPAKKDSESSDEDEESGEDVDSSDEDEESDEEESGSEVSGSGSNEGSSSAEGSGSNEGSESASGSGSEESS